MAEDCLFCQIGQKQEQADIVWEDDRFIAINNKYPKASIHVLVMPKEHVDKKTFLFDPSVGAEFWGDLMMAVGKVVQLLGLNESGYQLVVNGAGYNHFEHEHVHVMGGDDMPPEDS